MSNKKRKLTKNIERTQSVREKHRKERRNLLCFLVIATIIIVAVVAVRVFVCNAAIDGVKGCVAAGLLLIVYAGPIVRIFWNSRKICEANEQIAETNQQLQDWEKHLREI